GPVGERILRELSHDICGFPMLQLVIEQHAKLREKLVGVDVLSALHRQPMHEEDLHSRDVQASLTDFLAPVLLVELPPILLIHLVGVRRPVDALKDMILDEVDREQRRASRVKRLKDDLSVVSWIKVNNDDLKQVAANPGEDRQILLGIGSRTLLI